MDSILTVIVPSDTFDLTTVENFKSVYPGAADDDQIAFWIRQASGAIASYCNRVFALETVSEQFRLGHHPWIGHNHDRRRIVPLVLRRSPVTEIVSATENGTVLTSGADYEIDGATGLLYRLSNDRRVCWRGDKIVIEYSAGYELLGTLPWEVERACIQLARFYQARAGQDPLLRAEEVAGIGRFDYQINQVGEDGGLPPDVLSLLAPYRNIVLG